MAVYKRNKTWYVYYYITVNGRRTKRGEAIGPRKDVAETVDKKYQEMIKKGLDPRETITTATETEDVSIHHPVTVADKAVTLEQFSDIFLELHGNHLSDRMQESYRTSFLHLMPSFGTLNLHEITKIMVQTYMTRRKREGASNASVNREIACIKCMFQRAMDWGYIDRHPIQGLKLLKEAPIRERYLTREEAERLIAVSPDYLRDIIVFALATGFRKSEIFGLTWDNIILNKRFTFGEITVIGKGEKRRNIRMNMTVYDLLIRRSRKKSSEYVFTSPQTGGRIDNVNRAFKTALRKAGIENFRFHDLRHTSASWMVQGGADIYAVQKILGHTHIRTTQRYAHQSPEYLERQIGVLDDFLSPGVDKQQYQKVVSFGIAV